jgi:hypothetical protein
VRAGYTDAVIGLNTLMAFVLRATLVRLPTTAELVRTSDIVSFDHSIEGGVVAIEWASLPAAGRAYRRSSPMRRLRQHRRQSEIVALCHREVERCRR